MVRIINRPHSSPSQSPNDEVITEPLSLGKHAVGSLAISGCIGNYSVLKLTSEARPVLRGELDVQLAMPRIKEKPPKKKRVPLSAQSLDAADAGLFEALRVLRKELADEQGVPPYVIFGDATLVEMSRERPSDDDDLIEVNGVGKVKLERYGDRFLDVIAHYQPD